MIFEVTGFIVCDRCGKKAEATFPFELGGPSRRALAVKYPRPVEGHAGHNENGASYLCEHCYTSGGTLKCTCDADPTHPVQPPCPLHDRRKQ
jgi:hypothetical protein